MPQQPGGMAVVSSAAGVGVTVGGPNMTQQQANMVQAQRMKMVTEK